jgi:hypothetical protein
MMPTTSEKNSMTVPEGRLVLIRNSVAFFTLVLEEEKRR